MSERCEPPPEWRGKDGWHWVETPAGTKHIARWFVVLNPGIEPLWCSEHLAHATPAWAARNWGWRYLAPVTPPQTVAALEADVCRIKLAVRAMNEEVCQTLGKALGYPWFKDDQKNFPHATEADGVCVGDHVAESIAAEAARKLSTVAALVEALEECANDLEALVMREYSGDVLTPGNALRRARDLSPVDAARAALALYREEGR